VKVGKIMSDFLLSEIGCPQGTVLSSGLFIVVINSLLIANRDYDMITFADDTSIIFKLDTKILK
jgi:hypothetical protein